MNSELSVAVDLKAGQFERKENFKKNEVSHKASPPEAPEGPDALPHFVAAG